jgi:outer membrane protein OmpA-like peptidoglycan-associated protein
VKLRIVASAVGVVALASGCGSLFGRGPVGDGSAPAREVPVATRNDTAPPRSGSPPATSSPAGSTTPAAPVAPPSPVALARPSELLAAQAARRSALIADSVRLGADEVGYYMDVQEAKLKQLVSTGYSVARRDSGIVVSVPGPLTFEVSSARLLPSGLAAVTALAKVLAEYDRTLITLNGYTDSSGVAATNVALSQARAISLARQLIADGVAAKRIVAVGHGAADPLADNSTPEGRERNRRIEIRIDPVRP